MPSDKELRLERRQRRGGAIRRFAIPTIGAITPIGLIVVNISAFIIHHLSTFRLIVSVSAFVSGVLLGSWQALMAYRVAKRRLPEGAIFDETNEEVVLLGGMALVLIASFLAAYFCYQGLSDEKQLPNGLTFVGGAIAIAIPVVMQVVFQRGLGRSRRGPSALD